MAEMLKPVPLGDMKTMDQTEKSSASLQSTNEAIVIEHNPALDRKLLLKRDIVLIPVMGLLYMLLFLDRTNIANARALGIGTPTGLEGALHMPSNGYNVALVIFYIPFVLAEIPANIFLNHNMFAPRYLLGGQMCLLGLLGICQGLTQSYAGLLVVRFLMGIFEASLPGGATLMISLYYTKKDAAIRFAWFFAFALLGPFFSGLLAYAIQTIDGAGGYQGWRWVFIIEGLMTMVLSIPVLIFCPNFPQHAQSWFLKPDERDRIVAQLEVSRGSETKGSAADNTPLWKVLLDWRIHLFTMCFFCCDITAASISAFSPTILTQLGWTRNVAQLMSMPIWATGMVFSFSTTYISSKLNIRFPFVLGGIVLQLVGWIVLRVYPAQVGVRYMALFFMSAGTFPQMPILMAWLSANLRGHTYLAVGMAWMVGFGNCANFISSNVFITTEAPRYATGATTGLVFTILSFVLVCIGTTLLVVKNKKRTVVRSQMTTAEREAYDDLYFKFVL